MKMGGKDAMHFTMQVCSVTNPFCPESIGARWPDNSYTKSVGWSMTDLTAELGTNGAGGCCALFFPEGCVAQGSVTGTTATFTGSMSFMQNWPTGVVRYRITSWGLRVSTQLSPMTVSGMVRIRLFSPLNGSFFNTTSVTSNMADASHDIPLARLVGKDGFIIPAPLGDVNARQFRDIADFNPVIASYKNPGWQIAQVSISGGPASFAGAVFVNAFYNFELIFADGDAQTAFAQPPPENNLAVREASASVFSSVGNFFDGAVSAVDRLYNSKAARFAGKIGMAYMTKSPAPLLIRDVD